MTAAQAIIAFLKEQFVERDGAENAFFSGALGIRKLLDTHRDTRTRL
jgi:TPP-dependent trihydroxycyclohexane-1,2-dione (THcHDO) dehydratase